MFLVKLYKMLKLINKGQFQEQTVPEHNFNIVKHGKKNKNPLFMNWQLKHASILQSA